MFAILGYPRAFIIREREIWYAVSKFSMKVVVRGCVMPYTESSALKYRALTEVLAVDFENSSNRQSILKKIRQDKYVLNWDFIQ